MKQLLEGEWYKSKRGHLFLVDTVHSDGTIMVTSHYTGNAFKLNSDQLPFVKGPVNPPKTAPGTAITENIENQDINGFSHIYDKYPHVVPGSVYKVKNTSASDKEEFIKIKGKLRVKKDKSNIKGATRCKIYCQETGCSNTRDIKVQDAWQVTRCLECNKQKRKAGLKKFLDKKEKQDEK